MSTMPPHTPITPWVWGGGLLIASALVPLVGSRAVLGYGAASTVVTWVGMLAFGAALLVFAFGWGPTPARGSIVAGRMPGVVALAVLALWRPVTWVGLFAVPNEPEFYDLMNAYSYVDLAVSIGAGLFAVVAIARAGVVPQPWNWSPAWGFGLVVGAGVFTQVAGIALVSAPGGAEMVNALYALASAVASLVPMLLGILAIVLGLRTSPRPQVQVYPPVG